MKKKKKTGHEKDKDYVKKRIKEVAKKTSRVGKLPPEVPGSDAEKSE